MHVWNPYLNKDTTTLENVQRRATRIPHMSKGLTYEERCRRLGLTSLVKRRTRGDLVQMFKIINELDTVRWISDPLRVASKGKNRLQYRREIVRNCNKRHFFFLNRVCNEWNALPDFVVEASSLNDLKKNWTNLRNRLIHRISSTDDILHDKYSWFAALPLLLLLLLQCSNH